MKLDPRFDDDLTGWDRGDEPWNDPRFFDSNTSEATRRRIWDATRSAYQSSGRDTTRNEELFPDKARQAERDRRELRSMYGSDDDDPCFVATSAFENRKHPTVESLRQYRDQILANSPIGRLLIKAYYGGLGQAGAKALDSVPSLKPTVRNGLERLVARVVEPTLETKQYDSQRPYGNLVTVR